jgi:outer membrane lipoprotein-sorting protein
MKIGALCSGTLLMISIVLAAVVTKEMAKPDTSITARDVIQRMAKTYAECKSYRDTGTVTTVFKQPARTLSPTVFDTIFVRPSHFLFHFGEHSGDTSHDRIHYGALWMNGSKVQSWGWRDEPKTKTYGSIDDLVATYTGVSKGAAYTVPRLLLPKEVTGSGVITDLQDVVNTGFETFDGKRCFRITGKDGNGDSTTVWIDRETYLIRKIVESVDDDLKTGNAVSHLNFEETTIYKPELNPKIPASALELTHP